MPHFADRFPQPLKFQFSGAPSSVLGTEITFPLILPRRETDEKRIVTEILSVTYDFAGSLVTLVSELALTGEGTIEGCRISLAYRVLSATEAAVANPSATLGHEAIIDAVDFRAIMREEGAAGTSLQIVPVSSIVTHGLIGGAGNGILIPGDKIYFHITSTSATSTRIGVSIVYRQHLVGLTEFLGILAARQQHQ